MFIVWGRKIKRRMLGYVADFCPMCREERAFKLHRVGSASHIYYISFGEGRLVGYERTCCECGTSFSANAASYASTAKAIAPLEELKRTTFPNLDAAVRERLKLEERVKSQSLSQSERDAQIKAPFLFLSPKVESRFASTHIDIGVGLALVGAMGLLILAPTVGKLILPDAPGEIFAISLVLGMALVVWQVIASKSRFIGREILPVLAKSLAPLKPTEQEIERVLGELKQLKKKIAATLRATVVLEYVGRRNGLGMPDSSQNPSSPIQ